MAIAATNNSDPREMIGRNTVTGVSRSPVDLYSPQTERPSVDSCEPLWREWHARPSWYDSVREQSKEQLSELAARKRYQQALPTGATMYPRSIIVNAIKGAPFGAEYDRPGWRRRRDYPVRGACPRTRGEVVWNDPYKVGEAWQRGGK